VSGLFRRLVGRGARAAPPSTAPDYDPAPAEAAYRRLLQLAQQLRASTGGLTAAAARVGMREAQLRRSLDEYERLAQQAVANGRAIQAESALASAEAAQAALDALAPQAAEIATQKAALDRGVAKLEAEAAALRARLDASQTAQAVSGARARLNETAAKLAGHRPTVDAVVRDAEDEALRLEGLARGIAELYGQPP
jgi:phage shock protein A